MLRLERKLLAAGVESALDEFERMRSGEAPNPEVLDWLGWRHSRRDHRVGALALFRRNQALFPDEYVPT